MINNIVLVGLISSEIFFSKEENKNSHIKYVTFRLLVKKVFMENKNYKKNFEFTIKTYDFNFIDYKNKNYKNKFLALSGRLQEYEKNIFVFADKIELLGRKT